MKNSIYLTAIAAVLVSACTSTAPLSTPTTIPTFAATPTFAVTARPTLAFTTTAPPTVTTTPTSSPSPTITPAAVPSPTPTRTAVPIPPLPTTIKFNIDPGVASTDIEAVHQGVAIIHNYLETNLGGDNASSWPNFTIRVFDTTSQESCCLGTSRGPTGLVEPGPRFYTLHPDWVQHNPLFPVDQFLERQNFVAHEYTHSWQAAIGCIGGHSGEPLGPWLTEGMAVYVSFAAFEQAGYTTDDDALRFHVQSILSMGSAGRPDFLGWENPDHRFPSWAYSYAYLAVRKLVSDNGGPIFLRKLCDETAKVVAVTNLRDFLNLPIILKKLGVDKQSFYKALPAYLEEMLQKYQ